MLKYLRHLEQYLIYSKHYVSACYFISASRVRTCEQTIKDDQRNEESI